MTEPIPILLTCPACNERHVDEGEFATKVHHTHACQHCGMVWRPAIVPTVGVRYLPGFKNGAPETGGRIAALKELAEKIGDRVTEIGRHMPTISEQAAVACALGAISQLVDEQILNLAVPQDRAPK